jgi:hypothetical protein
MEFALHFKSKSEQVTPADYVFFWKTKRLRRQNGDMVQPLGAASKSRANQQVTNLRIQTRVSGAFQG